MKEATDALREFGLSDTEARAYLALLRAGPSTPTLLAQKTGVHRVNAYHLLQRLQEKGVVTGARRGKRRYFEAIDPDKLLLLFEQRQKNMAAAMPYLRAQRGGERDDEGAVVYKGKRGVRAVLEEIAATTAKSVCLFASYGGFPEHFPEYAEVWHAKLARNRVRVRGLFPSPNTHVRAPIEARFLPTGFAFPSTTLVYGEKVFVITWGENPLGILIESRRVAQSYRKYFSFLWKTAAP